MWLLKRFWHANIVYKVYILIILFIVVVATITVITRYRNASIEEQTDKIEKNAVQELAEEKTSEEETITIANTETNKKEETIEEIDKESKSNQINKEEKILTGKTSIQTNEKTEEVKQIDTKEEIREEAKESNNNKNEEIKQEVVVEQAKEEYKENINMINTMKNFIQNNPSEDMKNYGYEVVIDSSIVELTNQFTYTETRMKNFLKHRFGTIRIYARDYYNNGNLVMTECYIL